MKVCTKCNEEKPLDDFHFAKKAEGKRSSWCKSCKQAYESEYYRNNPRRREQINAQNKRGKAQAKAIVDEAKSVGCADCSESDLIVLEFDHLGDDKEANVSDLVNHGSVNKVLDEIAKCDVVCANCHRRRTHRRRQC